MGRDMDVLWLPVQQQVTYPAPDDEGLKPGLLEAIQNFQSGPRDVRPRNIVFRARNDARSIHGETGLIQKNSDLRLRAGCL